jgi:hypothetical protein
MRYIHNAAKRTEYGNTIEEGIVAADVAAKMAAANDMLARLRRAQATADLHNNMPPDAKDPSSWLSDGSGLIIDPVCGRIHNDGAWVPTVRKRLRTWNASRLRYYSSLIMLSLAYPLLLAQKEKSVRVERVEIGEMDGVPSMVLSLQTCEI